MSFRDLAAGVSPAREYGQSPSAAPVQAPADAGNDATGQVRSYTQDVITLRLLYLEDRESVKTGRIDIRTDKRTSDCMTAVIQKYVGEGKEYDRSLIVRVAIRVLAILEGVHPDGDLKP